RLIHTRAHSSTGLISTSTGCLLEAGGCEPPPANANSRFPNDIVSGPYFDCKTSFQALIVWQDGPGRSRPRGCNLFGVELEANSRGDGLTLFFFPGIRASRSPSLEVVGSLCSPSRFPSHSWFRGLAGYCSCPLFCLFACLLVCMPTCVYVQPGLTPTPAPNPVRRFCQVGQYWFPHDFAQNPIPIPIPIPLPLPLPLTLTLPHTGPKSVGHCLFPFGLTEAGPIFISASLTPPSRVRIRSTQLWQTCADLCMSLLRSVCRCVHAHAVPYSLSRRPTGVYPYNPRLLNRANLGVVVASLADRVLFRQTFPPNPRRISVLEGVCSALCHRFASFTWSPVIRPERGPQVCSRAELDSVRPMNIYTHTHQSVCLYVQNPNRFSTRAKSGRSASGRAPLIHSP
ncbi:unnamed protein product, partial [Protopolystoma xenopodis]